LGVNSSEVKRECKNLSILILNDFSKIAIFLAFLVIPAFKMRVVWLPQAAPEAARASGVRIGT